MITNIGTETKMERGFRFDIITIGKDPEGKVTILNRYTVTNANAMKQLLDEIGDIHLVNRETFCDLFSTISEG